MYLEHFGLRESPFRITPHTEFFFTGANRGATLEALIYAITHDEGIVKVSGEVGSGKTMLCRMLLERLPKNVDTVYLANPSLSRDEILYAIAEELELKLPEGRLHSLIRALQDRLIEIYAEGRQVVVMVDEAHAMPPESLEEIRLLSNLESNRHKLLHIVLFGQPELDERLAETGMRQLKERITHNFALEPLRHHDIGTYLMFRIRAAGYHGPDLFTPGAIQLISHASEGLTRRINILADKALLSAFSEDKHLVDRKQIKAAIRDAQFRPMRDIRARPSTWAFAGLAALAIAGTAFIAGSYSMNGNVAVAVTTPSTEPALAAIAPASARTQAAESVKEIPAQPPEQTTAQSSPPETPSPTAAKAPPPHLAERIAATDAWLREVPDSHHFIQLLRTDGDNPKLVEIFLENGTKGLDPQKIRVYHSRLSGRDRYGVIYGDFPTLEAAQTELSRIIRANPASGFYVRAVSKLR